MTTRDEFLATLRRRLTTPAPPSIAHPMRQVAGVPEILYADPGVAGDPVDQFCNASVALGCEVRRATSDADLATFAAEVVERHGLKTAVVSDDPEAAPVAAAFRTRGVTLSPGGDRSASSIADAGIAGCEWAIAATGTLVVQCARAGSRAVSLLPPVLVAVVRTEAILRDMSLYLRRMGTHYPDGLPSQFVFITGPSRSADIEQQLTVGVHGPGVVWIAVR